MSPAVQPPSFRAFTDGTERLLRDAMFGPNPVVAGAARRVLARYGAGHRVQRSPGRVGFVIANPGERVGDEHPYARQLGASLRRADVPMVLYRVP